MRKSFTKLLAAFALLTFLTVPTGMWGQTRAEGDTHEFSQSLQQLLNNNASIPSINIAAQSYPVKKVTISYRYNKTITDAVTMAVSVNGVSWGTANSTGTGNNYTTVDFEGTSATGPIVISFTNNTGSGTGHGTFYVNNVTLTEGASGGGSTVATPQISHTTNTYYGTQFVTISCGTTDANIYYTMGENPDEPTSSSTPYSGAIQVAETTTIKAIAIKEGMQDSGVATSTLTIQPAGFDQDWEGTMDGWKFVSVSGNQTWAVSSYNNNKFAKITGYANNTYNANEDWIISPAFNLGNYTNPVLTFTSARNNQSGSALEVYFSNDYAGGTNANPTWTQLTCSLPAQPESGYTDFTSSGDISLSSYSGANCYIGFKYTSTTSAAVTWEVDDIELFSAQPTITVSQNSLSGFTYIEAQGPSAAQTISVSGTYLEENLGLSLGQSSDFEMSLAQNDNYTNSLTLNQTSGAVASTTIYVRMKGNLAAGNHSGTITLTSTNADDKTVGLSGTVTGLTYTITDASGANGEITFSPESPVEAGTHVALTANATNPAYYFVPGSWSFFDENDQEVTDDIEFAAGEENTIIMPTYNLQVDATFSLKPTLKVTCIYDDQQGELIADPSEAYEGQTVTLSYDTETGYSLSSIVITKTSDGSATGITLTASGDDYTFTMPGYAVTATATFLSNTYEGSFVKYSGDITEGDYLIVYDDDAMNNTVSSSRLQFDEVAESSANIITNPNRNNVWHIANISQTNYWTIYNAKAGKYAAGTSTKNQADLIESVTDLAKWTVTESSGTYDFENYGRSQASSDSGNKWLRKNGDYGYACYASGTGGKLTLYKYNALTKRTITFNGNGGTYNDADTYTQDVYDGVEATLNANQFTRDGFEFVVWNNQADGNGATSYDDGDNITVTGDDLTLFAQWAPLYTLTIDNDIAGGSVSVVGNVTSAIEGTEITLSSSPTVGHAFSAWDVYKTGEESTKVIVTDNAFTMPAYNVTVSATFVPAYTVTYVANGGSGTMTDPSSPYVAGTQVTLLANTFTYAGHTWSGWLVKNASTDETINPDGEGKFEMPASNVTVTAQWTQLLTGTINFGSASGSTNINSASVSGNDAMGNTWTITTVGTTSFTPNAGWAQVGSSSKPATSITFTTTLAGSATIADFKAKFGGFSGTAGTVTLKVGETPVGTGSLDATNDVVVVNSSQGTGTTLTVTVTGIAKGVKCYYISFTILSYDIYGSTEITNFTIPEGKILTIHDGGVLTITNSLTNEGTADNLIIEDGGQLITSNAVAATVKKNVEKANNWGAGEYTPDGWYFIALPLNSNEVTPSMLTTGDYDLYHLNPGTATWENYKTHDGNDNPGFTLANGEAYLYANNAGLTVDFAGTVKASAASQNVGVSAGWNLVGNPFTYNTYLNRPYYKLNDDRNDIEIVNNNAAIAPCTGVLVKITTEKNVTFTKTDQSVGANNGNINIALAQTHTTRGVESMATLDKAILSFNEGSELGKFYFGTQNANIYIPMDNEEFAIVSSNGQGEMPVNFRAYETGEYTITVNPEEVEMGYLHLIDNIAGQDIDLLATPSYTFNARTDDYESRFRLVFSANMTNAEMGEDFAFISDGQLVIANEGEATLQVIDVTGRVVATESINGTCSKAINAKAGVYVLRLINGTEVKTQKMVIR